VAVSLVAVGAVLTGDIQTFSLEQRGTVMGAIVAVLAGVAYFGHRRKRNGGGDS
jgi:hypothetical protein